MEFGSVDLSSTLPRAPLGAEGPHHLRFVGAFPKAAKEQLPVCDRQRGLAQP